ncbi:MAG: glycine cleavage system protein H [Bacteroidales bacterium]
MVILIIIAFVVICITVDAVVHYSRQKKSGIVDLPANLSRIFNEDSVIIPKGIYYDKTHTWAFMEKNGFVKIGIDDFLHHITGSLNKIKMKNEGERIIKGEAVLSIIQNGKQLTINAPISGVIKSINKQLIEDSSLINASVFNEGWIYSVEPTNWTRDIQFLFMAENYKEWLKNEFSRLKDFFASIKLTNNAELTPIILQDGGELNDNILADFGPEIWEDFQTKFINTSK